MIDPLILLIIIIVGGPLGVIARIWYRKKEGEKSRFAASGTYVRDDSLSYSYDEDTDNEDPKQ